MPTQQEEIKQSSNKTMQWREFAGVNLTDARTSLDDKDLAWLENAMPIGKGNLILVPGITPLTTTGDALPSPISRMYGFVLNGQSVFILVGLDGSLAQVVIPSGVVTTIAPAGTVGIDVRMTIWEDSQILMIDGSTGYHTWDGTTYTLRNAALTGTAIAVFEGRVWIKIARRTIQYSAPNSFTDFTIGNGGGSTVISDSAFVGNITNLISALQQLWIIGQGAVNAISNVNTTGTPLTTTFNNTNIVSAVGSQFPSSVSTFFRTITFLTQYGVYAIVGATPQKLSDKLDGLFPNLNLAGDVPSAIGTIHNVFIWTVMVPYVPGALGVGSPRNLLLCFTQGKWFFASTPNVTWIASTVVDGQPEIWGTDGAGLFQMFADSSTDVAYVIKTKLFDFGDSTQMKELNHFGMEFQSSNVVSPTVTLENEFTSAGTSVAVTPLNTITFVGSGPITFVDTLGNPIIWIVGGLQLVRNAKDTQLWGNYLGFTFSGDESVWTLAAVAVEVRAGGKWNSLAGV